MITDTRVSGRQRHSDSVNKAGHFHNDNFHGVVYGTGSANIIEGINKNMHPKAEHTFEEFVKTVYLEMKSVLDSSDRAYLESARAEIYKKAEVFLPEFVLGVIKGRAKSYSETEQTNFIKDEMKIAKEKYDKCIEQQYQQVKDAYDMASRNRNTLITVTGFDKKINKIRQFQFNEQGYWEINSDHIEIGSGSDGANLYFSTTFSGINSETPLSTIDLILHSVNAFNYSTVNHGVGGTPKIIRISEKEDKPYSPDKVRALVNLSGAYISKFNEKKLNYLKNRQLAQKILSGDAKVYSELSAILDLNETAIKEVLIPFSSWQERTNHKLYGNHD